MLFLFSPFPFLDNFIIHLKSQLTTEEPSSSSLIPWTLWDTIPSPLVGYKYLKQQWCSSVSIIFPCHFKISLNGKAFNKYRLL
jgi:hypothetical protein